MTLTVRLDAQIFKAQRRGGISRYFVELMRQYESDPSFGIQVSTPFRSIVNAHLAESFPGRYRTHTGTGRLRAALDRLTEPGTPSPADVVHHTYYDPAYLAAARGVPSVTTVHDMIPELFPSDDGANAHRAKREYVMGSTAVICVSETTRRDLVASYSSIPAEIVVVPHGVGDEFRRPARPVVDLPAAYGLFVGHRGGYKDWDVLVDAWTRVTSRHDLDLVCIGGGAFSTDERELLERLGLARRVHHLSVSDADLPGVYAGADVFAFPSRYEGFGLPILEAFAAGCPVVAADIDCFREVADTAAALFPAGDAEALADQLHRVLEGGAARARLVDAGRVRAADFTWSRTAALTADVYRGAAG